MHRLLQHPLLPGHLGISCLYPECVSSSQEWPTGKMAPSSEMWFSSLTCHQMSSSACSLANEQHKAKNTLPFLPGAAGFSRESTEHFFPSGELPNSSKLPTSQVIQATFFYSSTRTYCHILCRKCIIIPVAKRLKNTSMFFSFKKK